MERNEEQRNEPHPERDPRKLDEVEQRDFERQRRDESQAAERKLEGDDRSSGSRASESLIRDDSQVQSRRLDDASVRHHHDNPTVGDQIGEAAGGISGVLAGAAIGSLGGPIGTVIGGVAGAIGGWWTGRAIAEAASNYTHADDSHYRRDFDARDVAVEGGSERDYDAVRPAYQLGHIASRNPDYTGRAFEDVEPELRRGWTSDVSAGSGEWDEVREYARTAYYRSAESQSSLTGDDDSHTDPDGHIGHYDRKAVLDSYREGGPEMTDRDRELDAGNAGNAGNSYTRQGDVPLNHDATDSIGDRRSTSYDNIDERSRSLRAESTEDRNSFTDPVAGEGVENIGSSGLSPRGDHETINEVDREREQRGDQY
ncbi:MAG TPA: hypothetical protein VHM67_10405 [Gemmatimonadaceae bacterium]|nr:hypothetical protein [Gemmatimonadaceae bacterium]